MAWRGHSSAATGVDAFHDGRRHAAHSVWSEVGAAPGGECAEHAGAVAELAVAVADELGVDAAGRNEVKLAGLLHDIGKSEIPEALLEKPAPLDHEERELMRQHTVIGERLVRAASPSLGAVARIVRHCHERWDGGGYPEGLAGEEIPLSARIVFCCDSYHAMTTDRPYRRSIGHRQAMRELRACAGSQFDPRVAGALLRVLARREQTRRSAHSETRPARPQSAHLALAPATS